ncbi:MAG: Minf_1886 family protein [Kiritimatiellia bacterium]|nr:Minf_1886 family protein [Kiritimatiellia bacterium]
MMNDAFKRAVQDICRKDPRYSRYAYDYVANVLDELIQESRQGHPDQPPRHITGSELARTIGADLVYDYGPLASSVLRAWGVSSTSDFGDIVYNLIEAKQLSASPDDKRSDFDNVYDFHAAFDAPYEPPFPPPYDFKVPPPEDQ